MDRDTRAVFRIRLLSFFRAHTVPILFWPILGLAIGCFSWFILLRVLDNEKVILEQQTFDAAAKLAQAQAAQVSRNLAMIDQILLLVRMHWQTTDAKLELGKFGQAFRNPKINLNISVFDAEGHLLRTDSPEIWPTEELESIVWMPFFSEQKWNKSDSMFIGIPRRRDESSDYLVRFSRKLLDDKGAFAGLVVVVLKNTALIADFDTSTLGKNGFVASIGIDGVTRTFQSSQASEIDSLPERIVSLIIKTPAGSRMSTGDDFGDSISRYLSWRKVDEYPLIVLASADRTEPMARLNERRRASIQTAVGASVALAGFVLIATVLAAKFAHKRMHLQIFQDAYRKATESGNDGFYIFKPIHLSDNSKIDYLLIDCNERGAAFLKLSRKDVVGSTISKLQYLFPLEHAGNLFAQAMSHGAAEAQIEELSGSKNGIRYLRVKAFRSDDVLAITVQDVTLEKTHIEFMERKNLEDALTNLPNRAWIRKALPDMLTRADRTETHLAVLFVDLDGFKLVNDTLGHAAGDEVLQIVAKRLTESVRPNDHVIRLGGDEFIVVLENLKHQGEAEQVAARVLQAFQAPCTTAVGTSTIGTSIGISIYPDDAKDVETLFNHADIAMYEVKTKGKNRYHFFDPTFYSAMQLRTRREKELRAAIADRQFVMHYQARVDLKSRCITSLEALVRWSHPAEGLLGPDEFIPLAEETGLIINLGEQVIDMVCAQIAAWSEGTYARLPISINVSSRQFNERDIRESIIEALNRHNVDASCVEIELTESSMIKDPSRTAICLQEIHALGVRLLVDDFGTGYSSLSMLHQMDFDVLKVDRSFTSRLGIDKKSEVFFHAIITMAHSLGMKVVAEGVESMEQIKILDSLSCDELQGYYLSRPLPPALLPDELRVPHVVNSH